MNQIAIITDTDCSIPLDISKKAGIRQVPIIVQFGSESFEAGLNLNDQEAFARIDRTGELPKTSAPSPGAFAEAYRAAFEEGAERVICFCVSSAVSATFSAAINAKDLLPDRDITVIDTRSLTMGQGFMVLEAADAAAEGASKEQILARAESVRQRTHLFAALPTLKYLAMSGRVGSLAAGMAGLLNIQPILSIQDGKLDLLERTRTRKKAWNRVFELSLEALDGRPIAKMAVVHVDAPEMAADFVSEIRSRMACPDEILVTELTPGMSVHTGAGLVGTAMVRVD